jgi:hypothetical protein
MEKHSIGASSKIRKPYQKPSIERVQLVAAEAVLSGCKMISGQFGSQQTVGCMAGIDPCNVIAS